VHPVTLAHMAALMMGEGFATYQGRTMPGLEALRLCKLTPIILGAKDGLTLINGTQFSLAYALAGLFGAWRAAQTARVTSAMSTDAIMGSTAPLHPEIHALRGHKGQIDAATMRALPDGSIIRESHRNDNHRVQDPYYIRCQPQVTGAAMDVLRMAGVTLETEANAATDSPLVLSDGQIVSGGNFHAELVGFAADMIALSISEIGGIANVASH
jgi:histidine ammonia-lyase